MEELLMEYGFKKDGLYTWINDSYQVMIYYDGITISFIDDSGDVQILYESLTPKLQEDKESLIESHTKLKKINKAVEQILSITLYERIYSSTSLYISNAIINYIKFNNTTEEELCKDFNINKEKLILYLSGSYNFTLEEMAKISVLIKKPIIVK